MSAAPRFAVSKSQGDRRRLSLENDPHPVIAIDVDAAEIVSANSLGSEALGLFPYASFPIALDPKMPAMVRLRELAAVNDLEKKEPETLTFWSNGRLKDILCRIVRQGSGAEVILLRVVDGIDLKIADSEAPEAPSSASEQGAGKSSEATSSPTAAEPTEKTPAPQTVRSLSETLKEIARQIREGELPAGPRHGNGLAESPDPPAETVGDLSATVSAPQGSMTGSAEHLPRKAISVLDPDHLAKLAHELKTPLTAIAAAAEVMRDERLGAMGNPKYLSYAADIHENATHALDVITSLLSESGRPSAQISRLIALDLNAIVERTVSSVQALAQSRGLTLLFEAEMSRPHVVANPTALRQILLNLLTNAIKYTPRGGDVRVVTGYLDDGRVFLVVRDTGCGIGGSAATAPPVASANGASQRLSGGSGIGLPLVRRLVQDMGAELEIDSAPGKGTVILIAFGGFAHWTE
jgi:signal transduction histidine kinase